MYVRLGKAYSRRDIASDALVMTFPLEPLEDMSYTEFARSNAEQLKRATKPVDGVIELHIGPFDPDNYSTEQLSEIQHACSKAIRERVLYEYEDDNGSDSRPTA